MAKMGAPIKEMDIPEFEKLCKMQCTETEISAWFGFSDDTLNRRCVEHYGRTFAEVYNEKRQGGRASLRRVQWQKAVEDENVVMLIWLGKQYLGQSDKQESLAGIKKTITLKYSDEDDEQHSEPQPV